jgi:hypothetical protein
LADVPFLRQEIHIDPLIAQNFSLSEITNIAEIEAAYGVAFSADDLRQLERHKFVIKNLLDTNMVAGGLVVGDSMRELVALYQILSGESDYKERTLANSVFISSDVALHLFSVLSTDLLKEIENEYLFDQMQTVTTAFFEEASTRLASASSKEERTTWEAVQAYFAVPYALLANAQKPLSAYDYWHSEAAARGMTVEEVQHELTAADAAIDSFETSAAFVRTLNLGASYEEAVLADLAQVYEAREARGIPNIFAAEFAALPPRIQVRVPFTLFQPRGSYTSSSLRRQYFRTMQWYQQIPFLLESRELTTYAIGIGEVLREDSELQELHAKVASLLSFVVGESDDLELSDYAAAVRDLGDSVHDQQALRAYLASRKPEAKIKAMPVDIQPEADVTHDDMLHVLEGMRFVSQKFIPDAYWTSSLTQGDEEARVNGQRLPDQVSMLQVLAILGSSYAQKRVSHLPFYAAHKDAIDTRMTELVEESLGWDDAYWRSSLYLSSLWTIGGSFKWLSAKRSTLPQFMQSPFWEGKTLLTAAGFWTELRHMSILYAKQSFAEMGGGGGDSCDLRAVPSPAKGYVEPNAEVYDRLYYAARRLAAEYEARDLQLKNHRKLEAYISFLETLREYTKLQLENNSFHEEVVQVVRRSYDDDAECTETVISSDSSVLRSDEVHRNPASRWEELRVSLIQHMVAVLPEPVDGPILSIKDKRMAVVADVHTDADGMILEQGTGVPRIIFVAVKDANGPRLTVGFTYSHYETISDRRLTDEEWQQHFYTTGEGDYAITYRPKLEWPAINTWFVELLGHR